MKIYKEGSEQLHELLKTASAESGATMLVPDLQRPYVWTPAQVTLLVDSLLRGWPFGTLLLWSVQKEELAGIPSRPFWRTVDRTDDHPPQQVGRSNPPAQFRMVLDGQQRLQSLLLAFGGDDWGFRLRDHEWSDVLGAEAPKGRNAKQHWSLGHLCLDLLAFRAQLERDSDIGNIDFRDALTWAVLSPSAGRSSTPRSTSYRSPLENGLDATNRGRFIRLSRLWDQAPTAQKPVEKVFRDKLRVVLDQHDVDAELRNAVLQPLAELMIKIVDVKQANVSYLELSPFDPEAGVSQDAYNDAIVNIFTRLNTAGRALTRQEITFAWIKNGWGDGSQTGNRTAGKCFDDLRDALKGAGLQIEIDELVGMVSAMWAVTHRHGALLNAADLLRGEQVRPMAQDLVVAWSVFASNAVESVERVSDRRLVYGTHYRSLNVLTLLITWRLLGRMWLLGHPQSVTERDALEKEMDALFSQHCDRWLVMSQWAGRWGKSTDKVFADYAKELALDWQKLGAAKTPSEVLSTLRERMEGWIDGLRDDALRYVDGLAVSSRDRVRDYHMALWLWHRLDGQRWAASQLALRDSKKRNAGIEVDHVVSVKLWEGLQLVAATGDQAVTADDEAEDWSSWMNALGNCCLLEKTFNIAKGSEPLAAFLGRVHEFASGTLQLEAWSSQLGLNMAMVNPAGESLTTLGRLVEARTQVMKAELREYVSGSRQRADC